MSAATGGIAVRRMEPGDLPAASTAFLECWDDIVPSPESAVRGAAGCARDLVALYGFPGSSHLGAWCDAELAGFLVSRASEIPGERQLHFMCVRPGFRGRGVGSSLVAAFLASDGSPAWVRTWSTNAASLALYAGQGFVEQSRIPGHRAGGVDSVWLRHP